jgi:hypothetical protein
MERNPYERDYLVGTRRSRTLGLLLVAAAVIALASFGIWMSPGGEKGREVADGRVRAPGGMPGSVATTGQLGENPGSSNSGPGMNIGEGNPIHDLETIMGVNDGHELVGRRVDIHAPVQQHVNDVAFWIGSKDNRLLVVLARDTRDGVERQRGEPSKSGLGAVPPGQQATISGTIQRVPYGEAMYSWGLTNADRAELMDRRIYLKADSVR